MDIPEACVNCDAVGTLVPFTYSEKFKYEGTVVIVDGLEAVRCSSCNTELIFYAQAIRNHDKITDAKEKAHDS